MCFDEYAKNWDTEKRIERAKVIAEEMVKAFEGEDHKNHLAMEFGCGTGLISFNLYDKFKSITLIDSSRGMIDILNDKIDKYKITNMLPMQLDITEEEIINDKFDVIYNSMVLHHIEDIGAVIKRFYQLLNNGGNLYIVDLNEEDGSFHEDHPGFEGHNGFNQQELKNLLSQIGFRDIEAHTFYKDEKITEDKRIPYSLFILKARK